MQFMDVSEIDILEFMCYVIWSFGGIKQDLSRRNLAFSTIRTSAKNAGTKNMKEHSYLLFKYLVNTVLKWN